MAAEGSDEAAYAARLPPLPPSHLSPAQLAELERVASSGPLRPVACASSGAQGAPPPPLPPASADPRAWRACADAAATAVESQGLHALNVELAARYGVEAWRTAVGDSASLVAHVRRGVEGLAADVAAVNAGRAAAQESSVARIAALRKRARDQQADNLALAGLLVDAQGRSGSGRADGSGGKR